MNQREQALRNLEPLERILGVTFRDKTLLLKALTHRSFLNENRFDQGLGNNERLEFLGDAVLELVVTEYLYRNLPDHTEGHLTQIRSALVCTKGLAIVAEELHFRDYLRLSRGERQETKDLSKVSARRRLLNARIVEAVIGALYLDRGILTTEMFIQSTVIPRLEKVLQEGSREWKSRLQELMQAVRGATPYYLEVSCVGPDESPEFTMAVYAEGDCLATGIGHSKAEASSRAAYEALRKYVPDLPTYDE